MPQNFIAVDREQEFVRVTRSRELVAAGYRPAVVARVAQISRRAIYRIPKTRLPRGAPFGVAGG